METLEVIGQRAREAKTELGLLGQKKKTEALHSVAEALCLHAEEILAGNRKDTDAARENGMSEGLLDRLTLTVARIEAMAEGLRKVAALPDPVGNVLSMEKRPNGLLIGKSACRLAVWELFMSPVRT